MPGRSVIVRIRFVALLAVPAIIATLLMPSTSASASPLPAVQGQAVGQDSDEPTPTLLAKPKKNKKKWQAKGGARFNNPMIEKQRFVIERHIIQAIRNSPKGSKITISAYSLDRGVFARELIAAYRRGVKVQVLLNDHQVSGAQVAIQRVIGAKAKKKSFLRRCVSGCRADQNEFNNLHSKFYLFSQTGKSRHVVMLGSQNMTLNAVRWQWNDLFTIPDNEVLYDEFQALFNDMRPDWKKRRATYEFCDKAGRECPLGDLERYHTTVFPRFTTQKRDVIMHVLNNIQCRYVDPETGKERRTVLRLSMHTMRGSRGNYLADKLRSLYALGCDLKVNYGLMGFHTKEHIGAPTPRGRVPLRSTGFSRPAGEHRALHPPQVLRAARLLQGQPAVEHGVDRLDELGQPRHPAGRDSLLDAWGQAGQLLLGELRRHVAQAVLAGRLHHDVRIVATGEWLVGGREPDHHGGTRRPTRCGSDLGERLRR